VQQIFLHDTNTNKGKGNSGKGKGGGKGGNATTTTTTKNNNRTRNQQQQKNNNNNTMPLNNEYIHPQHLQQQVGYAYEGGQHGYGEYSQHHQQQQEEEEEYLPHGGVVVGGGVDDGYGNGGGGEDDGYGNDVSYQQQAMMQGYDDGSYGMYYPSAGMHQQYMGQDYNDLSPEQAAWYEQQLQLQQQFASPSHHFNPEANHFAPSPTNRNNIHATATNGGASSSNLMRSFNNGNHAAATEVGLNLNAPAFVPGGYGGPATSSTTTTTQQVKRYSAGRSGGDQ
jgi:hypothetical protein